MLQTVNVRFAAPNTDESQFEGLFNRVANVLHDRLEAMDPSVGATGSERLLDVMLSIEAPSPEAAVNVALDKIHQAIQVAGYDASVAMLKSIELLEPAEAS